MQTVIYIGSLCNMAASGSAVSAAMPRDLDWREINDQLTHTGRRQMAYLQYPSAGSTLVVEAFDIHSWEHNAPSPQPRTQQFLVIRPSTIKLCHRFHRPRLPSSSWSANGARLISPRSNKLQESDADQCYEEHVPYLCLRYTQLLSLSCRGPRLVYVTGCSLLTVLGRAGRFFRKSC